MRQRPTTTGTLTAALLLSIALFAACERPPERGSPDDIASEQRERSSRDERHSAREERRAATRMETRDVPVENFNAIDLRGTAELQITVGPPASVQLSGSERVLKVVDARVHGETLDIDVSKGRHWFSDRGKLKIVITVPTLKSLESNGAGEIDISGFAGGELNLTLAGAHNVKASGTLDSLKLELEGAGNVDFRNVPTADAKVEINGAANVELHVTESLKGEVNGVGAIRYSGDPKKVESELHGLGTISAR